MIDNLKTLTKWKTTSTKSRSAINLSIYTLIENKFGSIILLKLNSRERESLSQTLRSPKYCNLGMSSSLCLNFQTQYEKAKTNFNMNAIVDHLRRSLFVILMKVMVGYT